MSDVWGGSPTDNDTVEYSGILKRYLWGDRVGADKGYTCHEWFLRYGVTLVTPPRMVKNTDVMAAEATDGTCTQASVRIHVERHMRSLKQWQLLKRRFRVNQFSIIGDCVFVCAMLSNITESSIGPTELRSQALAACKRSNAVTGMEYSHHFNCPEMLAALQHPNEPALQECADKMHERLDAKELERADLEERRRKRRVGGDVDEDVQVASDEDYFEVSSEEGEGVWANEAGASGAMSD